jgi:predicted small secreted protein
LRIAIAVLVLAVFLLSSCTTVSGARRIAIGATAADSAVTVLAVNRGAREVNPALGQRSGQILAINAAILAAVWYLSRDLSQEQQLKLWRWMAVIRLGAVVWDGREMSGGRAGKY